MNSSLPYYLLATGLETSDAGRDMKHLVHDYQVLAYITGLIYVSLIFSLKAWMKNRKPFKLAWFSRLWNFSLFVINSVGFLRTVVHVTFVLRTQGFQNGVCNDEILMDDSVSFFWTVAFPFVKIIELGDTFFIVLQKRFLATFYWAHHFAALMVTWFLFPFFLTITQGLGMLVYFNHIPIYLLATIKSFGIKLPQIYSTALMVSEVMHLMSGLFLCSSVYYFIITDQYCDASFWNNSALMATYVLCFVLCAFLLCNRFLRNVKSDQKKVTPANTTKQYSP